MAQFYRYRQPYGSAETFSVAWDPDVIRLGTIQGFTEKAEHCQTGTTNLTLDDPDADLGYSGDAVRGLARLEMDETSMASNQRVYTGIFGDRTYSRREDSSLLLDNDREIEAELHDLNSLVSLRVIPQSDRDAIRGAETVSERMSWIVGSTYLQQVADNGLIASNSTTMTKADYRGQRPVNVINDCELAAGFGWNAFVYYDDATQLPSLFFANANTSTAYSSVLRLTNNLADVDEFTDAGALTFAADDIQLRRSPTDVGSGVYLPFKNGAVYRTRQETADYFGRKDLSAPNSNVSKRSRAREQADDYLAQHASEEDRITCTVELPPGRVNHIRAGHRIQVKFTHLPGYTSWTWCRVLTRSPGQIKQSDDRYTMTLELSPQEAAPADDMPFLVQYTDNDDEVNIDATFDDPVTIGNVIVALLLSPQGTQSTPEMQGSGWTQLGTYKVAYEAATPFIYASAWAKVADSTTQTISRETGGPTKIMFGAWEIANAAIADVEVLSAERQGDSPMTIGTFSSDGFAVMSCGVTRGNDQTTWSVSFTPGTGWTERHDNHMDGNSGSYFADATVDGSLVATGTINILGGVGQTVGEWVGFAVRFF